MQTHFTLHDIQHGAIEEIFALVFRCDFSTPGFCIIDLGKEIDAKQLKKAMMEIKKNFNDLYYHRFGKYLYYLSMDRTSRQFTTKFHLEATMDQESILMLGYEPSVIKSALHVGDYSKYIYDHQLDAQTSMKNLLQIFGQNPCAENYITKLNIQHQHFQIIVLNNSFFPEKVDGRHMLGVMHKGVVPHPLKEETRIINAIALGITNESCEEIQTEKNFMAMEDFTPIH
ncbi:hypothetical protein [Candidatus Uabimicrobium amorphum]|uniref:Uncharacterized protein n=1 Tax=Uabimicrobium amorphum TaxID=2596890 RepID=A0A5S9F214_UABAM|nr:hypothetical protein [Candidatus Uabimicrobium amorphum]BBM82982.1 hypothetical protein UABAM_01325 [Candidatus Uabimicrobium amorphum]